MVYWLVELLNAMLKKCRCGGIPTLHIFIDHGEKKWFVCCYRMTCNRRKNRYYKSPLRAAIAWNFRDWDYKAQNNMIVKENIDE